MDARRSISRLARRAAAAGLAVLALSAPPIAPAWAETFLIGTVVDAVTRQPIAGAELTVARGGETLGTVTSGTDGAFRVPFTPPVTSGVATLTLTVTASGFDRNGLDFQVVDGEARGRVEAALFPAGILSCRTPGRRSVVIGDFLAPVGQTWPNLPDRVAAKLDFGLGPIIQTVTVAHDLTPAFVGCGAVKAMRHTGSAFAKTLGADAVVAGMLGGSLPSVVATTYVADAHGLFVAPPAARSTGVNLDDPFEGPLSGDTYVAVLAAVAAGLAEDGNCVGALTLLNAAAQVSAPMPAEVGRLRARCEADVPNAGLLPES